MLMRTAALAMSVSLALAACAARPQHYTELSVGRIVDRSDHDGGPSGHRVRPLVIPAGNVTIQLTTTSPGRSESEYFFYRIRTASGRLLQTQSTQPFNVGDCVQFWHAPLAATSQDGHNFVSGTLEMGTGCTWP
jgi:hypothetical protein